jgi:hypothetical protein
MTLNPNEKPRFSGKVTASVTHEIQNVLAIIKERAGLMQDLLALGGTLPAQDLTDRIKTSLEAIQTQVKRGVRLTSGLNGFAHTADHDRIEIDIPDLVGRLVFITERLTRGKEIVTQAVPSTRPLPLLTDPLLFQMAVHLATSCLYRLAEPRSSITVACDDQAGTPRILLSLPAGSVPPGTLGEDLTASADWESLRATCDAIDATATVEEDLPGICLAFSRPRDR